jgi:hypothetical protein
VHFPSHNWTSFRTIQRQTCFGIVQRNGIRSLFTTGFIPCFPGALPDLHTFAPSHLFGPVRIPDPASTLFPTSTLTSTLTSTSASDPGAIWTNSSSYFSSLPSGSGSGSRSSSASIPSDRLSFAMSCAVDPHLIARFFITAQSSPTVDLAADWVQTRGEALEELLVTLADLHSRGSSYPSTKSLRPPWKPRA